MQQAQRQRVVAASRAPEMAARRAAREGAGKLEKVDLVTLLESCFTDAVLLGVMVTAEADGPFV